MKIFHLASEYPPQTVFGLGRFVHDITVEAGRQGHEVHVITNSMNGKEFEIDAQGVHVHRVHFPPPPKPADPTTTVIQFNTQVIERAIPLIRKAGCDVVASHDWLTFLAGNSLQKIFGSPHILTIHDTMIGKKFGNLGNPERLAANIERYGCDRADMIICCSEFIKQELLKIYGATEKKIRVIPCAVDESRFAISDDAFLKESFRSVLADPDEVLVSYIGRLDEEKGLEVLLNAIPDVLRANSKIRFVLAGKGVMEESIRMWIEKNNLGNKINLSGYLRGKVLSYLYKVSDIQVIPSTYEPFGIVALEGMVAQCAVIVAETGGLAEIIEHGKDGLLFSPGDSKTLAQRILSLSNDRMLRKRLALAGYEKAKSKYNWESITRQTLEVYGEAQKKDQSGVKDSLQQTPPLLEVPAAKTWIAVIGKGQKEAMAETLEKILANTQGEYEIVVIENASNRELAMYLTDLLDQGKISRIVLNKRGTVPSYVKGYAIAQAVHLLSEEFFDTFCWMDCGVKVKPGWLEGPLALLARLGEKTPVVVLEKRRKAQEKEIPSSESVWIMQRSFFARFGLPPIGIEDKAGTEYLHYIHKLRENHCTFALLDGLIE